MHLFARPGWGKPRQVRRPLEGTAWCSELPPHTQCLPEPPATGDSAESRKKQAGLPEARRGRETMHPSHPRATHCPLVTSSCLGGSFSEPSHLVSAGDSHTGISRRFSPASLLLCSGRLGPRCWVLGGSCPRAWGLLLGSRPAGSCPHFANQRSRSCPAGLGTSHGPDHTLDPCLMGPLAGSPGNLVCSPISASTHWPGAPGRKGTPRSWGDACLLAGQVDTDEDTDRTPPGQALT